MKKRVLALGTALVMALALTACGGSSGSEPAATAAAAAAEDAGGAAEAAADDTEEAADTDEAASFTTVSEGKLTVATSPDFAPYEFYAIDEDGTPTLAGFDIALAQFIADDLGLELEMVTVDFDGVISELQTKSVDLGIAGLSPDPAREGVMDFSDVYYEGGQSLVSVQDKADQFQSFDDVNQPNVTVAAQIGSIQMNLAQTHTPDADIISLPKVTDIISELVGGKLDCAYIETAVAEAYQRNYPELAIVLEVPYDVEGDAIGVCKGNAGLLAAVNSAIAKAIETGAMDEFVATANEQASGETYEGLLE